MTFSHLALLHFFHSLAVFLFYDREKIISVIIIGTIDSMQGHGLINAEKALGYGRFSSTVIESQCNVDLFLCYILC